MKRATFVAICVGAAAITCHLYLKLHLHRPGQNERVVPADAPISWNDAPVSLPDYVPVWRNLPGWTTAAFAMKRDTRSPKARLYLLRSMDAWTKLAVRAHQDTAYRMVQSKTSIKLPTGRNSYEFTLVCFQSRAEAEVRRLFWAKAAARDHWLGWSGEQKDLQKLTETADTLFDNVGVNTDFQRLAQECIDKR